MGTSELLLGNPAHLHHFFVSLAPSEHVEPWALPAPMHEVPRRHPRKHLQLWLFDHLRLGIFNEHGLLLQRDALRGVRRDLRMLGQVDESVMPLFASRHIDLDHLDLVVQAEGTRIVHVEVRHLELGLWPLPPRRAGLEIPPEVGIPLSVVLIVLQQAP